MSSQIGKTLKVSVFGESHGKGIGAVIDGFPAGEAIDMEELLQFMARRRPGRDKTSTARKEDDLPEILSGIKDGVTCGTPIAAVIRNTDQRSKDYKNISHEARPGHADFTGYERYHGFNDIRGGGHFSGRLTAPLVFAGGLCRQYLARRGIYVGAHLESIAGIRDHAFDPCETSEGRILAPENKAFPVIDDMAGEAMREAIEAARLDGDSVGGVVEIMALGMPAGIGSPMFDTVEGRLALGLYGIPAVKGVSFGNGFEAAAIRGSENNDAFYMDGEHVRTETNHHGGALGGITSGMPVIAHVAFKPTPSIAKRQKTIDYVERKDAEIQVQGRHDPCVVIRAVPVVEAVTSIILMDLLLGESN